MASLIPIGAREILTRAELWRPKADQFSSAPPMINQIDWRGLVCQFLQVSPHVEDNAVLASLHDVTGRLEASERRSRQMAAEHGITEDMNYLTIHRIRCTEQNTTELSLGFPWPVKNADGFIHLRGKEIIDHLELHLERNKWVAFIVYKDYTCCKDHGMDAQQLQASTVAPDSAPDLLVGESVSIISWQFGEAMDELWSLAMSGEAHPKFDSSKEFSAPYLWWYCHRDELQESASDLEAHHSPYILLFQDYIDQNLGEEYREVDQLLAEGKITARYMPYLYVGSPCDQDSRPERSLLTMRRKIPGEVQLSKLDGEDAQFHRAFKALNELSTESGISRSEARVKYATGSDRSIFGLSWSYDGFFQRERDEWLVRCSSSWETPFDIQDLKVHPLRFADPEVADALRCRGEMFWECRSPTYISYRKDGSFRGNSLVSHELPTKTLAC